MVEVVNKQEKAFEHTCQSCWSHLKFSHEDIILDDRSTEWECYPDYWGYITCPNCNKRIFVGKVDVYKNEKYGKVQYILRQ